MHGLGGSCRAERGAPEQTGVHKGGGDHAGVRGPSWVWSTPAREHFRRGGALPGQRDGPKPGAAASGPPGPPSGPPIPGRAGPGPGRPGWAGLAPGPDRDLVPGLELQSRRVSSASGFGSVLGRVCKGM